MTLAAAGLAGATVTAGTPLKTLPQEQPVAVASSMRRAFAFIGDLLLGLAVVLCIPFVMLALGTPLALCIRFLLWMTGTL